MEKEKVAAEKEASELRAEITAAADKESKAREQLSKVQESVCIFDAAATCSLALLRVTTSHLAIKQLASQAWQ